MERERQRLARNARQRRHRLATITHQIAEMQTGLEDEMWGWLWC